MRLVLQDDGRRVIRTSSGRVLWSMGQPASAMLAGYPVTVHSREQSVLSPGQYILSPDGRYVLVMQQDGNGTAAGSVDTG